MKKLGKSVLVTAGALALIGGLMTVAAEPASARVVCNRWGDCWSTHYRHYPYAGYRYDDPYYDPYYRPYYRPYYSPGITFGFSLGGGGYHRWHHW